MYINGIETHRVHFINELQQVNTLQYVVGLFNCCLQIDTHMVKDKTNKKIHKIKLIRCKNELF